jgi:hypothetical protein
MGLDSQRKKRAAAGLHWRPMMPLPAGAIDAGDLAQMAGVFPGFWYGIAARIADWIAEAVDGSSDPDGTLTLNIVEPEIIDFAENHFDNYNVFLIAVDEDVKTETIRPSRLATALIRLSAVMTSLPAGAAAGTVLARVAETIRRAVLAGNSRGRACNGLALNLDCPMTKFAPGPGCEFAVVDCFVKYFLID